MHIPNSCIGNDDHFTLLINTGNAHKSRMLSPTNIYTAKKCERGRGIETQSKIMMGPNDGRFHNCRNKLFSGKSNRRYDAGPFRLYICGIKFFGCAICLVSGIAIIPAIPSQAHLLYSIMRSSGQVIFEKTFFLNSVLQYDRPMVLF